MMPSTFCSLKRTSVLFLALGSFTACGGEQPDSSRSSVAETSDPLDVPAWAKDAVWYQVFTERFRNGDPSNDPTLHDIEGAWPHMTPEGWEPTQWTQDWYRQEDWAAATGKDVYTTIQLRRYGGDLQGVIDQLDYLRDLGVTALFLNPINDSPSLHKYDARNYRHIDRNLGPDPRGDEARMAEEDPADPATWTWTAADRLFLELVDEVHRRGMRIIIDYSWNHTGITFWAWKDILENQDSSAFADWYAIEQFDDAATPDTNEFTYSGWAGVPELPELRKVGRPQGAQKGAIDGTLVPPVREHVFNVTRRWLDPDGDGDPSDGVDGFRLDVAEIVPLDFWREYRQVVREVNPKAYLVGEVWWEQWPDRMYDPDPWLQGDVFDAVMNYRWYEPTRSFFAGAPPRLSASQYVAALDSVAAGIPDPNLRAMMNLTSSHDSPRISTSLFNRGRYKHQVNPKENPDYRIDQPDRRTREIQEMILVQQFTWIGAPHVWYGDEVGMWGGDDPDSRKPMVWDDLDYEDEATHPMGRPRNADRVQPDLGLFETYQGLIALRRNNQRLFVDGDIEWLEVDDANRILVYERSLGDERAIVAFNASDDPLEISVEAADGTWRTAYPVSGGTALEVTNGTLEAELSSLSARVWILD